jgi:chromosome segregation ATPase
MKMDLFKKHVKEPEQTGNDHKDETEYDATQYLEKVGEKDILVNEGESEQEEKETETSTADELQAMSMPELWQRASGLGISKKGNKEELIKRILDAQKGQRGEVFEETDVLGILDQLKNELKDFEKIREGIRTKVESTSKLVPKLNERKELLEKEINEHGEKISEIVDLIPKLEGKKANLLEDMQRKKEEIELLEKEIQVYKEKISEISDLIPKLGNNRKRIQETMEQKKREISRIDTQINQILSVQKYGIDLVSTLVYANKKSKQ